LSYQLLARGKWGLQWREWRALPEIKRQADSHAEWFAMMIKDKYPFRHSGSDRYQAVRKIIIRYQNLIGAPLK
jgi:hypothetical protein